MTAWILSLALTIVMAIASWIPDAVGGRLALAIAPRFGAKAQATLRIVADPFFELPFGRARVVDLRVKNARFDGFPVSAIDLDLEDVRLMAPFTPVRLAAPARATLSFRLTGADLGAIAGRMSAAPPVRDLAIATSPGRIVATGEVDRQGARVPFEASFGLSVGDGFQLMLVRPALRLAGQEIPSWLLGPILDRLNPVVDLGRLGPVAIGWRLVAATIDQSGVVLTAKGRIDSLSGPPPSSARPTSQKKND